MDKDRNFNDIVIYRRLQFGRHTIYKGSLVYNEVLCTVYALNAELPRMRWEVPAIYRVKNTQSHFIESTIRRTMGTCLCVIRPGDIDIFGETLPI